VQPTTEVDRAIDLAGDRPCGGHRSTRDQRGGLLKAR